MSSCISMSIDSRSLDKIWKILKSHVKMFTDSHGGIHKFKSALLHDSIMVLGIEIISLHGINNWFLQQRRGVYCAVRSDSLTVININFCLGCKNSEELCVERYIHSAMSFDPEWYTPFRVSKYQGRLCLSSLLGGKSSLNTSEQFPVTHGSHRKWGICWPAEPL
jgi:hypothetical protein